MWELRAPQGPVQWACCLLTLRKLDYMLVVGPCWLNDYSKISSTQSAISWMSGGHWWPKHKNKAPWQSYKLTTHGITFPVPVLAPGFPLAKHRVVAPLSAATTESWQHNEKQHHLHGSNEFNCINPESFTQKSTSFFGHREEQETCSY